jgi:hypothetical protein
MQLMVLSLDRRLLELFPHVYLKVVAGPYTPLLRVYSFMLFALMDGGSYQIRLCPLCWPMLGKCTEDPG